MQSPDSSTVEERDSEDEEDLEEEAEKKTMPVP